MFLRSLAVIFTVLSLAAPAGAADECADGNRNCLLEALGRTIDAIPETHWRDTALREYAKTLAFEGRMTEAIALVSKIQNPDTKAMTIRGIGMAASDIKLEPSSLEQLWTSLREEAEKIDHEASYAIALTYIAMAQAFAGDDERAAATASEMENSALRNKAFGETAEIQAERGDFSKAMKSLNHIDSPAFRDKAYLIVSEIFAKNGRYCDSSLTAGKIENVTIKAKALQSIIDYQNPRDVEKNKAATSGDE